MSKITAHLSSIVFVALIHGWAYWSAMSNDAFDWSSFANFSPFLFVVASTVGSATTLTFLAGFLAEKRFKMTGGAVGMFAVIYLVWLLSAFVLYVTNTGVDAYSATLGVFIYMPIHCAVAFIISLFFVGIFCLFTPEKISQK